MAAGRYAEALRVWKAALEGDASDPELLLRAGIASSMLGDYPAAETYLGDAYRQAGDDPKMAYNLALLALRRNRLEEARNRLEETRALCDWFPGVAYHLGVIAERAGDVDTARRYYVAEMNASGGAGLAWQRYLALCQPPSSAWDGTLTWTMIALGAGALLVAGFAGVFARQREKRIQRIHG